MIIETILIKRLILSFLALNVFLNNAFAAQLSYTEKQMEYCIGSK